MVTLRWEKVAVPFKVGVNTHEIVAANLHNQLRGLSQYSWEGWDDAANYLLQEKIDLDEALKYSDRSIQNEARYDNFMTKAQVLDALGRKDEATTARNKALDHGQRDPNARLRPPVANGRQGRMRRLPSIARMPKRIRTSGSCMSACRACIPPRETSQTQPKR